MVRIGDVFEIPLTYGRRTYGQYVFNDKMGPLIQIFDLISENRIDIDSLKHANPLFPPVITGLRAAIRAGLWTIIGRFAVEGFKYPGFISALYDEKTGEARMWYFWDGEKDIQLGVKLPEDYKKLEYLVVWSQGDVTRRIETGEYPYPYGDLIKHNRFVPQTKNE